MMALLSKALSAISASNVDTLDERRNADRVEALSRQQHEAHEIAERVGERQDFGRHAAFGAADGLALSPPFAPCPWRWTLTMVASTMAYSMSGSSETASNSRLKTSALTQSRKRVKTRVPVAERGRQIAPGTAGAGNPQHGLDKQPVVLAAATGIARLAQTMRLHLRPLGVSQNESVHPKLESQPSPDENPKSQQTLGRRTRGASGSSPWCASRCLHSRRHKPQPSRTPKNQNCHRRRGPRRPRPRVRAVPLRPRSRHYNNKQPIALASPRRSSPYGLSSLPQPSSYGCDKCPHLVFPGFANRLN